MSDPEIFYISLVRLFAHFLIPVCDYVINDVTISHVVLKSSTRKLRGFLKIGLPIFFTGRIKKRHLVYKALR